VSLGRIVFQIATFQGVGKCGQGSFEWIPGLRQVCRQTHVHIYHLKMLLKIKNIVALINNVPSCRGNICPRFHAFLAPGCAE